VSFLSQPIADQKRHLPGCLPASRFVGAHGPFSAA
jgi:hypothetical protein